MLFDSKAGVPPFQGCGFNVGPPALPPSDDPCPQQHTVQISKKIDFTVSIATGNVQSLGKGEHGFAGKLGFIRAQLAELHLNFLGLQETRSEEGASLQHGVFRMSSGCSQGQGGVELWCNLHQPFASLRAKKSVSNASISVWHIEILVAFWFASNMIYWKHGSWSDNMHPTVVIRLRKGWSGGPRHMTFSSREELRYSTLCMH